MAEFSKNSMDSDNMNTTIPPVIETSRLLIKPFTPELVLMPGAVREKPFMSDFSDDPYYKERYLKNPELEMDFAGMPIPEGCIILGELIFVLHRIAAGGLLKADYEAALVFMDKAFADNAAGKAIYMAAIIRKEQDEQHGNLAAIINLFNTGTTEPLLEIIQGTMIHPVTGYVDEAYRAFMQWARGQYGFSRFRLLDKRKGEASVPPDTITAYNPKEPDKEYYAHIDFKPEGVSVKVYEKPERSVPEIREIVIDCGGGLSMLVDITLERDGFIYGSDEPRNFVGSVHGFLDADGDTGEEVISKIRSYFEEHFKLYS